MGRSKGGRATAAKQKPDDKVENGERKSLGKSLNSQTQQANVSYILP